MTTKCEQCKTEIAICPRCRTLHCYQHYCPETEPDGQTKSYTIPPKIVWSELVNRQRIEELDKVFKRKR